MQVDIFSRGFPVDKKLQDLLDRSVIRGILSQRIAEGENAFLMRSDLSGIFCIQKSACLFGTELQGDRSVRKVDVADFGQRGSAMTYIGE